MDAQERRPIAALVVAEPDAVDVNVGHAERKAYPSRLAPRQTGTDGSAVTPGATLALSCEREHSGRDV
jgi:hypothetical protein